MSSSDNHLCDSSNFLLWIQKDCQRSPDKHKSWLEDRCRKCKGPICSKHLSCKGTSRIYCCIHCNCRDKKCLDRRTRELTLPLSFISASSVDALTPANSNSILPQLKKEGERKTMTLTQTPLVVEKYSSFVTTEEDDVEDFGEEEY